MKSRRTSLILIFLALALGGVVYYYEFYNKPQQETATSASKPLFNFAEADVTSFTVKTAKQPTVAFEKLAGSGGWRMKSPETVAADEGAIAFLLNLLATGKSDRSIHVPVSRKSEFGLDQPSATVEVKLANQEIHQLVLGKPNFNRSFLYALIDPPANAPQELSVYLVPIDLQNAVDRPIVEWKKDKPKPSPSPDATASPTTSPPDPSSTSPTASPTASPSASSSPSAAPSSSPNPAP